ncbi:MAG: type II toxin-antitoxin system RelE/ParE family toxin [Rhodocyclaceae bacterium]|jgi:plasmid stabilization system protein ParE|nr:type II toxin-antitoxin system RelE/ParE family toxin [Rhodocyclaceae bacterium]MBZ0134186.1 type II toxin-antitoxin system RelE/ParE family toxin [Rhodocyclaceae bacterium]MCO5096275.1 type II toxin-antitoxin system RelE/ParE family toxin [Rhodocyclaceae bacterium]
MKYLLHPEAEADLRDAAGYYRERGGISLSQALFTEFERSVGLLVQHPLLGALWVLGKRRLVMKHFPFSVIYTVASEELRILAVAHHSRRPGYWRKRK